MNGNDDGYRLYAEARRRGMTHDDAVREAKRSALLNAANERSFSDPEPATTMRGPGPMTGFQGAANALRTVAQGATFGLADEAEGALAAAIPGGRDYGEGRDAAREGVRWFREAAPGTALAGETLGGLMTGGAVVSKAKPIVTALAGGALYGGASAEGDVGDRLGGAALGAGLGGVAAGVGAGVPRAWRALRNPRNAIVAGLGAGGAAQVLDSEDDSVVGGLKDAATVGVPAAAGLILTRRATAPVQRLVGSMVKDAMDAGKLTATKAEQMLSRAGAGRAAEMRFYDLGESMRGVAQGATNIPKSRAQAEIPGFVESRVGGRFRRSVADIEEATGKKTGESMTASERLRGARKDQGDVAYAAARAEPDVVDDDLKAMLESEAAAPYVNRARDLWEREEAARLGRGEATEPFRLMSVRALHTIKMAMDDAVESASRAGEGNLARVNKKPLETLVGSLDRNTANYAAARRGSRDLAGAIDAVSLGRGGKGAGKTAFKGFVKSTADEVRRDFGALDPEQQILYQFGALDDLANSLNKSANTGKTLFGKNAESYELDKLRTVFGDDAVAKLQGRQALEGEMATSAAAMSSSRGSRTARAAFNTEELNPTELMRTVMDRVWSRTNYTRKMADEVGRVGALSGDDLIAYLRAVEDEAKRELENLGRTDLLAALAGIQAGRLAGPREKSRTR